ncbi:Ig-like domain-containing protein [Psychrosphaera ytuae]|uniref:Ig-like domain-containing protein n=1 Tax=Psychrosphaera ytuae TaxID=2820710 RepID=A0A975HI94_9GAMM|nr:Ig-like domain-containing protein [Psychrosphaera ytuae]QTH63990.1 Ig-like domain-containing protein [Psychrosphaera ytuae]
MLPTALKGSYKSFIVGLLSLFIVACGGDGALSDGDNTDGTDGTSGTYTLSASLQDADGNTANRLSEGTTLTLQLELQLNSEAQSGQTITLTNSSEEYASLSSTVVTTDANGRASVLLTGGQTAGEGQIEVTTDLSGLNALTVPYISQGVLTTASSSAVYLIPASTPQSEYPNITSSTLDVISEETPATLLVKVVGDDGLPAVNQLVDFDLSSAEGLVVNVSLDKQNRKDLTDNNGFAWLNLEVGDISGAAKVTVNLEDESSLSINIASAGRVAQGSSENTYSVYLIPASTPESDYSTISGSTITTISASTPGTVLMRVTDGDGAPVSGQLVSLQLDPGYEDLATIDNDLGTDATDQQGFAAIDILATDVSGAGTMSVTFFGGATKTLTLESLGDGNQEAAVNIGSIELLANSFQMASSASDEIDLIALVKDNKNNLLPDVRVSFEASSGGIEVIDTLTNSSGAATAKLNTLNNPEIRDVTVNAFVNDQSASVVIRVTGTSVKLIGNASIVTGDASEMSVALLNSDGEGIGQRRIFLNSDSGNSLLTTTGSALPTTDDGTGNVAPYVITDGTGNAQFTYVASTSGSDTLSAYALGATIDYPISVSPDNFVISTTTEEVPLKAGGEFTLTWEKNGAGFSGDVQLSSTRGQIVDLFGNPISGSVTTDASGQVTVRLVSTNAGPAILTARASGLTATKNFEFIAETAHQIDLQASQLSIGPNGQKTTISAVVRDKDGNLVKNRPVNFNLFDVSGGSIFPATDVTDSNGLATTVYTSNTVSAAQGVAIAACTDKEGATSSCQITREDFSDEDASNDTFGCSNGADGCVSDNVKLTVADRELFIAVGTGNTIDQASDQEYEKRFSIIVTDADSNPVEGVQLSVSAIPSVYAEGDWDVLLDEDGEFDSYYPRITGLCRNEDIDEDGVLDRIEDVDGDGVQDLYNEDLDNDNRLDLVNEDLDFDGNLDVNEDLDNDGNLDVNEDIDGDGRLDVFYEYVAGACDINDPNNVDLNNDGNLDVGEDRNCNGVLDPGEDVDGDGVLDLTEDLDGDGDLDVNEDVDQDGRLDTINEDLDADGNLDTFAFYDVDDGTYGRDLNNNGNLEANEINILEDIDNDGNLDVIEYDYNGDGIVDQEGINEDYNRNGSLEPGNVVSVIGSLLTDENGTTSVGLRYAESFGAWVGVNLVVKAKVAGTEYQRSVPLMLPFSAEDVTDEQNPPTSNLFGSDGNCATSF